MYEKVQGLNYNRYFSYTLKQKKSHKLLDIEACGTKSISYYLYQNIYARETCHEFFLMLERKLPSEDSTIMSPSLLAPIL